MADDPYRGSDALADQLTDALEQAECIFQRRFHVDAHVWFDSSSKLRFCRGSVEWCFIIASAGEKVKDLEHMSIAERCLVAAKLPELWQQCWQRESDERGHVERSVEQVHAFLKEHL